MTPTAPCEKYKKICQKQWGCPLYDTEVQNKGNKILGPYSWDCSELQNCVVSVPSSKKQILRNTLPFLQSNSLVYFYFFLRKTYCEV